MKKEELLDGTWEFIGQEIYLSSQEKWVGKEKLVKGLKWEFSLDFASDEVEHGAVVESVSDEVRPAMKYSYDHTKRRLTVDTEIQDIYEVIPSECDASQSAVCEASESAVCEASQSAVIRLSILTAEFPAPYMRYILRKI